MTCTPRKLRRIASGAVLAVSAGAAMALPGTGAGAVAAIQDDKMTAGPIETIPQRLALVRASKAKVARFDILWSFVAKTPPANPTDPNDPAYDWTRADQVLLGFADLRITPIITVYSTPDWAVAGPTRPYESEYNPNGPRPADYGAFMKAAATRYNGFFVRPDGVRLPKVRHWEVWNEPNLKNFYSASPAGSSIGAYKELIRAAYPNVKSANRKAIVIAGVGGPRSSNGDGSFGARTWMRAITRDKSLKFDAYSQHIYPSKGPRFPPLGRYKRAFPAWHSLPEMFKLLDKKKKGMKLYITEAGYTTQRTEFRASLVPVSFSNQAKYLRQIYNLPTVRSTRVPAVVWFNLEDNVSWPAGLQTEAGVRKPSFAAFVKLARKPVPRPLRAELAFKR